MSAKHVRWADASKAATPSPTWSDTSLPSESGPLTPSSPCIELPNIDVQLHPILLASNNFQIDFDVSLPASTASIRDPKLSQYALTQPATTPSLPYLEIVVPHLPWRLPIYPTVQGSLFVTVSDKGGSDLIAAAFRRRCKRGASKEAEAFEIGKGVKRIDFLEGYNIFQGLTPTKQTHIFRMDTSD